MRAIFCAVCVLGFAILCPQEPCRAEDPSPCDLRGVLPSFPYADGWLGGDGTLSVCLPDGKVLWIFSDSYVSGDPSARTRKKAKTMVNNALALASYGGGEQEIRYYWRRHRRKHLAFFIPPEPEYRFWPTHAHVRQDTLYVLMIRVGDKEDPDPGDIFSFTNNGMTMAAGTNLQADDPHEWKIEYIPMHEVIPGASLNQAGVDEDYLYVFKHAAEGSFLIRIPHHALRNATSSVEYWSTEEVWKAGSEGEDQKILYSGQANGSLEYFPELGHWLHVYGPNFMSNEIRYRYAPEITGPWSETGLLYVCPELIPGNPSYDQRHFCYSARVHTMFSDLDKGKLLVIYDCNSTEFFHAAGSDEIYIPVVVELDIPRELLPPR